MRRRNLSKPRVPAPVMLELRRTVGGGSQRRTAQLLGMSHQGIQQWEKDGTAVYHAYAYVGLAFRIGGPSLAREALRVLAQVDGIEGVAVPAPA